MKFRFLFLFFILYKQKCVGGGKRPPVPDATAAGQVKSFPTKPLITSFVYRFRVLVLSMYKRRYLPARLRTNYALFHLPDLPELIAFKHCALINPLPGHNPLPLPSSFKIIAQNLTILNK